MEEAAAAYDNIECCWSRAGNLADKIFAAAGVNVGGVHANMVPAEQLDEVRFELAAAQDQLRLAAAEPAAENGKRPMGRGACCHAGGVWLPTDR